VSACDVTNTSGHAILDSTACQLIATRFRFSPATSGGRPVAGSYSTAVSRSLPVERPTDADHLCSG
jgi:hypothetical protein